MIRTHDGKNMTKSKDEIDPRLLARRLLRVPDVHAHVLVVENCVAGRQKVDEAKEMPLELLDEDPALVEEVAEDDIAEDDEHHAQREPGHADAPAFLECVDLAGEPAEDGVSRRMGSQRRASIARTLRGGQRMDIPAGFC